MREKRLEVWTRNEKEVQVIISPTILLQYILSFINEMYVNQKKNVIRNLNSSLKKRSMIMLKNTNSFMHIYIQEGENDTAVKSEEISSRTEFLFIVIAQKKNWCH